MIQPFVNGLANGAGAAGGADGLLPFQGRTLPESFLKALQPQRGSFRVQRLAKVGNGGRPPIRVAGRRQKLMHKSLVVAVILHPTAVGALVLTLHWQAGLGTGVRLLPVVKLDQVAAHSGKHSVIQGNFDSLAAIAHIPGVQGHHNRHRRPQWRQRRWQWARE